MQDPEFLQSVLENLPGVDPNNEAIRNAMGSLASQTGSKPDTKKDEEKKKWTLSLRNLIHDQWKKDLRFALHVFIHSKAITLFNRKYLFISGLRGCGGCQQL